MSTVEKVYKSRRWNITINNPKEENLEHEQIKKIMKQFKGAVYWCMADEIGNEGHTYHTHLYLCAKNGIRFTTLKRHFPKAHLEKAIGTSLQNRNYMQKIGKWENTEKAKTSVKDTFEEWGEIPTEEDEKIKGQSNGTYYGTLYRLIDDGLTDGEIIRTNPNYIPMISKLQQIRTAIKENHFPCECRENLEIHYIYGPARWNKEKAIREQFGDFAVYSISDYERLFDDYDSQDIVIFKDFQSNIPFNTFVHYLEKYPLKVGSRYNKKFACYTKVYIMSDIPLQDQYRSEQMKQDYYQHTFLDKITSITYCKNETEEIEHPINFYYVEDDGFLPFQDDDTPTP